MPSRVSGLLCIVMLALLAIGVVEAPSRIEHVVMVSVDGLRPECIAAPIAASYPALTRLARGPHTLQARCDPQISVTLPNHIDMITGRTVAGDAGHGWIANDDPPRFTRGKWLPAGLSWVNFPVIASRLLASGRANLSSALLGEGSTGIIASGLGLTCRVEGS
jgi:hypothetical protein